MNCPVCKSAEVKITHDCQRCRDYTCTNCGQMWGITKSVNKDW